MGPGMALGVCACCLSRCSGSCSAVPSCSNTLATAPTQAKGPPLCALFAQALVEAHYSVELFWYPLNNASATKDFSPAAWDPYADRLMVFMVDRAAADPGGPVPEAFSNKPNAVASLETYLGAVATQVGAQTGNLAVQARAHGTPSCLVSASSTD